MELAWQNKSTGIVPETTLVSWVCPLNFHFKLRLMFELIQTKSSFFQSKDIQELIPEPKNSFLQYPRSCFYIM